MFVTDCGSFRKITGLATGNIYVVPSGGGDVVLVDCGGPSDFLLIESSLKSLGISRTGEMHLVLTHFHFDHAGSAARMKRLYKAKVWAHELETPILEGREEVPTVYKKGLIGRALSPVPFISTIIGTPKPVSVDIAFSDGDVLPLLGGLEVIHTPGHTPGSSSFFWVDEKVLFSGDAIINTFRFLTLPTKGFSCEFELARDSALGLIELAFQKEIRYLCTGHGPIVVEPSRQLTRFRKRLLEF